MKRYFIGALLFLAASSGFPQALSTANTKRLLVISGGGARGAWGAGVLTELIKRNGGYQAVFGTSTGSLMAPLILLQDMDLLDSAYTHVTQKNIFNKSPFNVKYDSTTGNVTTSLNLRAILRFIFGYKTFGETKNLYKLIQQFVTRPRYDSLRLLYSQQQRTMAVAVTNTRTGRLQLIYDSTFTDTKAAYDSLCQWIWASANEPLYMSYVPMGNASYVDGGVREVVPIQEGLIYAIHHDIDNVDAVINNERIPIDTNWQVSSGGILNGLERLLGIYDLGTVHYNETYALLLARYFNQVGQLPHPDASPMIRHLDSVSRINGDTSLKISELRRYLPSASADKLAVRRVLHLNLYCMPPEVAAKYQNELGFIQPAMQALLQQGRIYGADSTQGCFRIDIDREAIRQNADLMNNK